MIGVGVVINWFSVNYILAVDYWILMIILCHLVGFFLQINGPSAEFFLASILFLFYFIFVCNLKQLDI
jgi:hypothetical protein